jgi:hypothetical protein
VGISKWFDDQPTVRPDDQALVPPPTNLLFIIMPMDPANKALVDVRDAIETVAMELNLSAKRVDDFAATGDPITPTLLDKISEAAFVVADLSENRPNVFFEAGFALGRNKKPIYIAQEGTQLQFDLHDYPVFFFGNMRDLRERLKKILQARMVSNRGADAVAQAGL